MSAFNDEKVFISVIIPVYNGEKFIRQCLDSIITSSKQCCNLKIEIIVINDGSTDCSKEITEIYEKQNDNIILVNKKNGGVSSARNMGVERSQGRFLVFVDIDDFVGVEFFQEIKNTLRNKADFYLFDEVYYGDKNENYTKISRDIRGGMNKDFTYYDRCLIFQKLNVVWDKIFIRDLIIENGIRFDEERNIGEDLKFVLDYSKHIQNYYISKTLPYYYRKNINGTGKSKISHISDCEKNYYMLMQYAKERKVEQKYINNINCRFIGLLFNIAGNLYGQKVSKNIIYNNLVHSKAYKYLISIDYKDPSTQIKRWLLKNKLYSVINFLARMDK